MANQFPIIHETLQAGRYTVEVREIYFDRYDIRYFNPLTGWSCRARTRGFADYETDSLRAAKAKARLVIKGLGR